MNIVILDTNCSNLLSVQLSVKKLGYHAIVTSDSKIIEKSSKLLLPGVGSAAHIIKRLSHTGLIPVIKNLKCPVLGICLGMQLFSSFSTESQGIKMIGVIDEIVSLLSSNRLPLPHTGWNQIFFEQSNDLFKDIKSGSWFYFIHSYGFNINKYTIAKTIYHSQFSSAIQKENFFGVQFHPEKSGAIGLKLLLNFLEM